MGASSSSTSSVGPDSNQARGHKEARATRNEHEPTFVIQSPCRLATKGPQEVLTLACFQGHKACVLAIVPSQSLRRKFESCLFPLPGLPAQQQCKAPIPNSVGGGGSMIFFFYLRVLNTHHAWWSCQVHGLFSFFFCILLCTMVMDIFQCLGTVFIEPTGCGQPSMESRAVTYQRHHPRCHCPRPPHHPHLQALEERLIKGHITHHGGPDLRYTQ